MSGYRDAAQHLELYGYRLLSRWYAMRKAGLLHDFRLNNEGGRLRRLRPECNGVSIGPGDWETVSLDEIERRVKEAEAEYAAAHLVRRNPGRADGASFGKEERQTEGRSGGHGFGTGPADFSHAPLEATA